MKRTIWKKAAAIGMTFGMLISSIPFSVYADEMIVEDDSYIVAEDDTEAVMEPETEEFFENNESIIAEEELPETEYLEEDAFVTAASDEDDTEDIDDDSGSWTDSSGMFGYVLNDEDDTIWDWSISDNGELSFQARNASYPLIFDPFGSGVPWLRQKKKIKSVILPAASEVYLPDYFMADCDTLKTVIVPEQCESFSVGGFAFQRCYSLETFDLSKCYATYNFAFYNCRSLTRLDLNSIEWIYNDSFEGCTSVREIYFMKDAPEVGICIFADVTATAYYPRNNSTWTQEIMDLCENNDVYTAYHTDITWVPYDPVYPIDPNTFVADLSGQCGENVTWGYNAESGVLLISGEGDMYDYGDGESPLYTATYGGTSSSFQIKYKIKKVVIAKGVTSIGNYALQGLSSMTKIELPGSLTKVGEYAFKRCTHLEEINLSGTFVKHIGEGAFNECSRMENAVLPDVLESLGLAAFYRCDKLESISIANGNAQFRSKDGVLFNQDMSELILFPAHKAGDMYIVPETVSTIGSFAFSWLTAVNNIELTPMISEIKDSAFFNCSNGGKPNKIYYIGTKDSWDTIFIGDENGDLLHKLFIGYSLGNDTYSFGNYRDSHSGGHCFGMSMTSAGYYNGILDIGSIGGNENTPLYIFDNTATVIKPICKYQDIQYRYRDEATVAGGAEYLNDKEDVVSDWKEVVNYVKDYENNGMGKLQIGFRGYYYNEDHEKKQGGHAINFLRYEKVNGQDRIYAYDNNYPGGEVYFYQDKKGNVHETPYEVFDIRITTIALRDIKTYFRNAVNFNPKRALYLSKVDADIPGYSFSYMDGVFPQEEYVMYEIPMDQDKVLIVPKKDNAEFNYMGQTYEFGAVTEDTCGFLTLATEEAPDGESNAVFEIHNHTWDSGKVTKPATTTAAGIKIFTCTDCGETKTESIAKLKAQKPAEKITITKKPSIKKPTAAKGKITVKWKHFKHTSKKAKKIWKKIKKVQVQCATDKTFKNKVKDVKIGRGKTKYAIKGLKKKTTYYVRVRYYDGTGYSAWSKVKKVKTK